MRLFACLFSCLLLAACASTPQEMQHFYDGDRRTDQEVAVITSTTGNSVLFFEMNTGIVSIDGVKTTNPKAPAAVLPGPHTLEVFCEVDMRKHRALVRKFGVREVYKKFKINMDLAAGRAYSVGAKSISPVSCEAYIQDVSNWRPVPPPHSPDSD